jgi:signal transduction histidine kinase
LNRAVENLISNNLQAYKIQKEIEKQIQERKIVVHANRTLLESLINNLITNAIKHNVSGGEIRVLLNGTLLTVANAGVGKSLNREMLFRRFVRMNGSAGGSGLELAIARQICLLYGWEIGYEYENGRHRFEVNF